MIALLLLSLPVFGMVAVGWAATRARLVAADVAEALGAFAFRFALPALVLRLVIAQPVDRFFEPAFYCGYLLSGMLVFALVLGLSRSLAGHDPATAGAHATTATVGNLGYLGVPLLVAYFGERAAAPLTMAILAEIMVLLTLGTLLMSAGTRGDTSRSRTLLRDTVRNPILAATVLGTCLAATGTPIPDALERFLTLLGGGAGPTALFALGGALATQRVDRAATRIAVLTGAAKLLLHPAAAWLVLSRLVAADPFWVDAGVLLAALPSAGNVYVVAQRFGVAPHHVSSAITLSTVAGVLTVPCAAWWVLQP